jgi:hypothetical protein
MANNEYGQPTRLDFLIDGVKQATLVWSDDDARWDGGSYRMQASGGTSGFQIVNPNITQLGGRIAMSTDIAGTFDNPADFGNDGEIRDDGKVGYKPDGNGTTANWYEIKIEGGSSSGDSSGEKYASGEGNGDPHISPLFGEKYDL